METIWDPFAAVLVAIVGGFGAWFIAARKGSGSIKTSEASELWEANKEFRQMLIEEARARSAENAALRKETEECHAIQEDLKKRLELAERELNRLKKIVGEAP